MAKQLIIVESPAKVKTIRKFLGPQYQVLPSVGHVRDLPARELGVDEEHDFAPKYEIIKDKQKVVNDLRQAAAKADTVYLAPDPDREGEAIAWHVAQIIHDKARDLKRIEFNEITSRAVHEALKHPRALNENLFNAQQARRVLDRLVGYKISPLLWKTVKRGISAGRVQSVALRLIVEREKEREAFQSEEYWTFHAELAADAPPSFRVELARVGGKKAAIHNSREASELEAALKGRDFAVASMEVKERSRQPRPPFITSTLQQAANQRLGYSSKRTMGIAQRLYEGVELGELGLTALITYMRTDSTRIADEARNAAHNFISSAYGPDYLPPKARIYKARGGAQDAHEAIRPVDVTLTPDRIKDFLPQEQAQLYRLIWSRFVASQMAAARIEDTNVGVSCGHTLWRCRGERTLFPGFLQVMPEGKKTEEGESVPLPPLVPGQKLNLNKLEKEQKFTQPPARYSEASLVRELEEKGIGRPSTYAAIISTLQDRDYVRLAERRFVPTDLGRVVCEQMLEHFGKLMDVGFTADMEKNLDLVARGDEDWVNLMRHFCSDFDPALDAAAKNMRSMKQGLPAHINCPRCGKPLLVKFGKAGPFLACQGYPECTYTSNFVRDENGQIKAVEKGREELEKVGQCPECGHDLVVRRARTGSRFIACTGYPQCRYTRPFGTGVTCPKCRQGELVERSSRRGKIFYSCSSYPQCDFALWDRPVPEACPRCHSPYLVEKKRRDGSRRIICPTKGCGYEQQDMSQESPGKVPMEDNPASRAAGAGKPGEKIEEEAHAWQSPRESA